MEKNKHQKEIKKYSSYKLFFWFLLLLKKRLAIYGVAILVSALCAALGKIINAWIVKNIIMTAQYGMTTDIWLKVFGGLVSGIISWACWRWGIIHYNVEGRIGVANLEKEVFLKTIRLPISYFEEHHSGEVITKIVYDIEQASEIYTSHLRRFLSAIFSSIVYLIPMLMYNVQLTLYLIGISFFSLLFHNFFLKPMKVWGEEMASCNEVLIEKMFNIFEGMEYIRTYQCESNMQMEYNEVSNSYYRIQSKGFKVNAILDAVNSFCNLFSILLFLGIGIVFVDKGKIDLGSLLAIYTISASFRNTFVSIGTYLPQITKRITNIERIYDFLHLEEENLLLAQKYIGNKVDKEFAIVLKDVSFSYQGKKDVLENFSMKIPYGHSVALVGKTGVGKSTIAKLLLGFYLPQKGKICVCGQENTECALNDIRDMIAYVPQDPYLFEVSIAENIAYGKGNKYSEVSMDEIIMAAKIANAHNFIMRLPQGYNTICHAHGKTLSGGECQRITIARAIIKNAPILLLDEATSALDNVSEKLINESLIQISDKTTMLLIAHRESTISIAKEVVRLK